jgi:hypothetical protein
VEVGVSAGNIHSIVHKDSNMYCPCQDMVVKIQTHGQRVPCQAQCDSFGASIVFGLFNVQPFPVSVMIYKNEKWFQECFQKLYECWQKCVIAHGNYFEGNVV